jgi:hypothetical protein
VTKGLQRVEEEDTVLNELSDHIIDANNLIIDSFNSESFRNVLSPWGSKSKNNEPVNPKKQSVNKGMYVYVYLFTYINSPKSLWVFISDKIYRHFNFFWAFICMYIYIYIYIYIYGCTFTYMYIYT